MRRGTATKADLSPRLPDLARATATITTESHHPAKAIIPEAPTRAPGPRRGRVPRGKGLLLVPSAPGCNPHLLISTTGNGPSSSTGLPLAAPRWPPTLPTPVTCGTAITCACPSQSRASCRCPAGRHSKTMTSNPGL